MPLVQQPPRSPGPALAGLLPVDKPSGWTSHDVVAVARKALGVRRVGHGGTLDPFATGLLPILVGPTTRFSARLHAAPKVYAAAVRFGTETTTDDPEGERAREAAVPHGDASEIDRALARFRGTIQQVPPARSAIKVDGRRAYALHRAGEEVVLEPRAVRIDRIDIASWRPPVLRLLVVCGSGTYVRSLARDIGRALASAAHLAALRRLAVGALRADEAMTVVQMRAGGAEAAAAAIRPATTEVLALDPQYLEAKADRILGTWEDS